MFVIGIDVGGMSIKAGLIDDGGHILQKEVCPTVITDGYQRVVKDMAGLVAKLCQKADITEKDLAGVGIGCPGSIDSANGVVTYSGNLNFNNAPIVREFKKHTDLPVFIANDADCAALGETKYGSGEGVASCIMITLGTGIGTGFIYNNKLIQGGYGIGGEGGHICIEMDGELCTCGERGCWEAYASATALIRQTKTAMAQNKDSLLIKVAEEQGKVSGRTAFTAYKKGDKAATEVVKNYVKYVATGLITLINIFRPEIVILGGGISNEGEYFIKMVEDYVKAHSFGKEFNKLCRIVKASLGNEAGILGAGTLAMIN